MAKYLLDIHTLLWWQKVDVYLSQRVKDIMKEPDNDLAVSIASFWEIVIRQKPGKFDLKCSLDELADACMSYGIKIVQINFYPLNRFSLLPLLHRDPCSRLIAATAYSEEKILLSKDHQLSSCNEEDIW